MGGSYAAINLPQPISTIAYNVNNQLTQWGTASLFYDANGNMTSDGTNAYTWDARNRLASMNLGAVGFQYDPFGRRVGKTVSGITTNYLYDGANVVQELSGTTPTANLLSGGVDEVFTRTDASGARHFLTDALGTTLALSDSAGTLQTQYTYEPYGNTTATGAASGNPYQYTGRENDGTGLYYFRARYYNSALQRFVSEDPIGFVGGFNLYTYAGNQPTDRVDPTGTYDYPWHVYITYQAALNAGFSPEAAMALARRVADVDFREGTQGADAAAANTHAMSGRKSNGQQQTCQQAYQATQDQLLQDVDSGELAKALHTIQDSTSPAHRGFQPWNGGYTPLHLPGIRHFLRDTFNLPSGNAIQEGIMLSTAFLNAYYGDNPDTLSRLKYPSNFLPQSPCGP